MKEQQIELDLISKLKDLKYSYREDIRDRAALERNFREKFEELNRVKLTDNEFSRLLEIIITSDVYAAARTLRERNSFERDDGTQLNFTLVNIKDWCKNTFEVINQLRINTDNSHHRYDVILLINGVPVVQVELKTLQISPRRAMQQIVDYRNDPGNGYPLHCSYQCIEKAFFPAMPEGEIIRQRGGELVACQGDIARHDQRLDNCRCGGKRVWPQHTVSRER
jgi:type I restriction enzyme R subunit